MDLISEADSFSRWIALIQQNEPVEFIHGKIVHKAMPTIEHGGIQSAIIAQLFSHASPESGKKGWWLSMEVDMFIGGEGVRPDLVGWKKATHPIAPKPKTRGDHKGVITTAPDWVCEVLSPSTASRDMGAKRQAYHRAHVDHYWIVDHSNDVLSIYKWSRSDYSVVLTAGPDDGRISAPPFGETEFDVHLLFQMVRQMRESQAEPESPGKPRSRKAKGKTGAQR